MNREEKGPIRALFFVLATNLGLPGLARLSRPGCASGTAQTTLGVAQNEANLVRVECEGDAYALLVRFEVHPTEGLSEAGQREDQLLGVERGDPFPVRGGRLGLFGGGVRRQRHDGRFVWARLGDGETETNGNVLELAEDEPVYSLDLD